jgi:hypothetical protein
VTDDDGHLQGIIRWEDPPPPVIGRRGRRARRAWSLVAYQLRQNPGRSALIDVGGDGSLAARINNGESWWAPPGAYEATTRVIDGRRCVWACYIGGGGQQ